MWIVALGSLDLGHEFVGPFDSEQEAQDWIDKLPKNTWLFTMKWPIKLKNAVHAIDKINEVERRTP